MYKTPQEQQRELLIRMLTVLIALSVLLVIGMFVYHFLEGWTYKDALYYSTISLTTRGVSTVHPQTWAAVLFTVLYFFIGVGIIVYAISSLIGYYVTYYQQHIEQKVSKMLDHFKDQHHSRWKWFKLRWRKY